MSELKLSEKTPSRTPCMDLCEWGANFDGRQLTDDESFNIQMKNIVEKKGVNYLKSLVNVVIKRNGVTNNETYTQISKRSRLDN